MKWDNQGPSSNLILKQEFFHYKFEYYILFTLQFIMYSMGTYEMMFNEWTMKNESWRNELLLEMVICAIGSFFEYCQEYVSQVVQCSTTNDVVQLHPWNDGMFSWCQAQDYLAIIPLATTSQSTQVNIFPLKVTAIT